MAITECDVQNALITCVVYGLASSEKLSVRDSVPTIPESTDPSPDKRISKELEDPIPLSLR